jgi:hypothetical protein
MVLVPQVYSYPLAHRGDSSPGATAGTAGDVDLNKYSLAEDVESVETIFSRHFRAITGLVKR